VVANSILRRTVQIGHRATSVSLEDDFWQALRQIAKERGTSVSDLVAIIEAKPREGNLSSAIRVWVVGHYQDQISARKRQSS